MAYNKQIEKDKRTILCKNSLNNLRKLCAFLLLSFAIFIMISIEHNHAHADSITHCWDCGRTIYRNSTSNCSLCGWDICPSCGACSYNCDRNQRTGPSINRENSEHSNSNEFWSSALAIAIVAVVGYFIYKYYKDK